MFLANFFEKPKPPIDYKKENESPLENCERSRIEVTGGTAEVYDYRPDSELQKSAIPLMLAPGCGGDEKLYHSDILKLLKDFGRRVITLDHPECHAHTHELWKEAQSKGLELKAHNILDIIEAKGLPKVDAVAHSEGAINLITVAARNPERFRNIILVAPAGFIGKDSFGSLALRFAKNFFADRPKTLSGISITEQEKILTPLSSRIKRVLRCIYGNLFRVLSEIEGIAKSDIYGQLKKLKEAGIKIIIVAPVEDEVFPIERIQKMIDASDIDGFYVIRGGHGDITRIPHFMNIVGSALETLEGKESSK